MSNNIGTLGFNGEHLDSTLDNYHLGNGYRAYNPAIMAFTAPDDMSPFGHGGINPYVYVSGDPINNIDPTGHFNFLGFGVNLGLIAFGIGSAVAAVATGGVSIGATIAIAGALYGTYTGIQGIAKDAQQNHQGLSTDEAINLGVTVGTEALGFGVGKLFEKLSTPLAKLAENGPFKLSGGPEDAAQAGRAFSSQQIDDFNQAVSDEPLLQQHNQPGSSAMTLLNPLERVAEVVRRARAEPMFGFRYYFDEKNNGEFFMPTRDDKIFISGEENHYHRAAYYIERAGWINRGPFRKIIRAAKSDSEWKVVKKFVDKYPNDPWTKGWVMYPVYSRSLPPPVK